MLRIRVNIRRIRILIPLTDQDPADLKKRIRILVKCCTHTTKNETSIFLSPLFGKKNLRNVKV